MAQQSGWYPDPDGTANQLRWWDGTKWTDLTTPGETPEPPAAPEPEFEPLTRPAHSVSGDPLQRGAPPEPDGPEDMVVGPGDESRWSRPGRRLGGGFGGGFGTDQAASGTSPARRARRFAPWALALVAIGVLLVWQARSGLPEETTNEATPAPTDSANPLSRLCEQNQDPPDAPQGPDAPVSGPRVADTDAGISYRRLGPPWLPWNQQFQRTQLGVMYRNGYFFVTQRGVGGDPSRDYLATVLSGSVPATTGDSLHPDMECVAVEVADDVRRAFYPQSNQREPLTAEPVSVSGHPGFVITYRLSFDEPGYTAKGELVGVLVVDVGRPEVAVLYVSIPDTHRQFDPVVEQVIASARVP